MIIHECVKILGKCEVMFLKTHILAHAQLHHYQLQHARQHDQWPIEVLQQEKKSYSLKKLFFFSKKQY